MQIALPRRFPLPSDAVHTALIALVVVAIFAAIRFPIHFPDSVRYIGAASDLRDSPFAVAALPLLLHPVFLAIGPWAFMLLNGILLVWTAAAFSRTYFQRVRAIPVIVAMLLSGAVTMSATILMDVQTSFAVLAILVLARERSWIAWIVLVIGLISHGSAIPILAAVAVGTALLFRSARLVAATGFGILAALGLMALTTLLASGSASPAPRNALIFLTSRMMGDVPQSVVGFAEANPSSAIAENLAAFRPFLEAPASNKRVSLLWGEDAAYPVIGYDRVAAEASDYIWYSIRHYPLENLEAVLLNGVRFILNANVMQIQGAVNSPPRSAERRVAAHYPYHEATMKKGLQYRGLLGTTFNATVAFWSFWAAAIWCAGLIVSHAVSRGRLDRVLFLAAPASVFCYVLANAYVIGNLSGVGVPRQHVRMLYVPVLFMCLGVGPVAAMLRSAIRGRAARDFPRP